MPRLYRGHQTLPLNGWRARELAEDVYGKRDSTVFQEGDSFIVDADVLQALPAWDGENTDYLSRFTGRVLVEVIYVDLSYAVWVAVTQVAGGAGL